MNFEQFQKAGFVRPSPSDVHVNRPLTNVSLAFIQSEMGFVADRVFPVVPSAFKSDSYYTFDRGYWNKALMKKRAPSTKSAGGDYKVSTATFNCDVWGFHKPVDDQSRANTDPAINLDRQATRFVTQIERITREVEWVSTFFTQSSPGDVWTFDVDGASSATAAGSFDPTNASNNDKVFWDDASSTPIEDVEQGMNFVEERTGFRPNVLTCQRKVFSALKNHPDIVGRLDRGQTPNGPAMATREAMARLFEVDEILVMSGIRNTADEGLANAHSYIGGKHALLSYRPPAPGIETPSAGYTFAWAGYMGATGVGTRITRWFEQSIKSTIIEIESAWDQKVIAPDLGYFFGSIVR